MSLIHGTTRIRQHCTFSWVETSDGRRTYEILSTHCGDCISALRATAPMATMAFPPPVQKVTREEALGAIESPPAPVRVDAGEGPLVLIVEDERDQRDTLRDLVERSGYAVAVAEDGRAALRLLLNEGVTPAVILLDLVLPFVGGRELLALLRAHARLASIPVVVVSGSHIGPTVRQLAYRCLMKPVPAQVILDTLEEVAPTRVRTGTG